jgi:hypothetical protein
VGKPARFCSVDELPGDFVRTVARHRRLDLPDDHLCLHGRTISTVLYHGVGRRSCSCAWVKEVSVATSQPCHILSRVATRHLKWNIYGDELGHAERCRPGRYIAQGNWAVTRERKRRSTRNFDLRKSVFAKAPRSCRTLHAPPLSFESVVWTRIKLGSEGSLRRARDVRSVVPNGFDTAGRAIPVKRRYISTSKQRIRRAIANLTRKMLRALWSGSNRR